MFIVFEGIDAAGKSTQIELLANFLKDLRLNREIIVTREPGGTPLGRQIRNIVLHTEIDKKAEFLLYAADRAHHVSNFVLPALNRGAIVLQDRFIDSSIAYQAAGRGLSETEVRTISNFASSNLTPHITFILDLTPQTAIKRIRERGRERKQENPQDKFEAMDLDFYTQVRTRYLQIYRDAKDKDAKVKAFSREGTCKYFLINAERPLKETTCKIRTILLQALEEMAYIAKRF